MMNDHQEFAGPLRVRNIVLAVPGLSCARHIGALRFARLRRRLQMRVEHLDLGIELGLDLRQFDLRCGLELLMDRIGLCLLLLDLRTMGDR
ncbi:hypothetical protein AAFG13_12620 [Bradyrhizobium sp. B124]|uniref:hypothetical protein n=1 Tax=Bradyrhizobium sp. B124 TaxID=3140245 RepID=UPI0031843A86